MVYVLVFLILARGFGFLIGKSGGRRPEGLADRDAFRGKGIKRQVTAAKAQPSACIRVAVRFLPALPRSPAQTLFPGARPQRFSPSQPHGVDRLSPLRATRTLRLSSRANVLDQPSMGIARVARRHVKRCSHSGRKRVLQKLIRLPSIVSIPAKRNFLHQAGPGESRNSRSDAPFSPADFAPAIPFDSPNSWRASSEVRAVLFLPATVPGAWPGPSARKCCFLSGGNGPKGVP